MTTRTRCLMPAVAALTFAITTACGENLDIANRNNPDAARAYASPTQVEAVVAGLGVLLNNAERNSNGVNTQSRMMAGEQFGVLSSFLIGTRSAIPRVPIVNDQTDNTFNVTEYSAFQRLGRYAANAIAAVDDYRKRGLSLGSEAQDTRAKSFAYLMLGEALGYVAMAYDSGAILTPLVPTDEVPPLSGYQAVHAAALSMLDSAILYATSAAATNGANGFPLPTTWISGQSDLTQASFMRLVHSYRARIRAGVARTPAERTAVDWNAVIADATNGLAADHMIQVGGSTGWNAGFDADSPLKGWTWTPMFYCGMADVSGGYDTWLRTPTDQRHAFLVVTPDKRWPQGTTRTAQQAEAPTIAVPAGRYVRNRPSVEDNPQSAWGDSFYTLNRWGALNLASGAGFYADMTKAELDLLAAEGYIRTGNLAAAAALIDITRLKNGLPSVGVPSSATVPLSTSPSCVPRVPQGPDFTSTVCGSLWEALKYEKRMETALTGYMVWFTDNRGWGDLVTGTILEWPVPYGEMLARFGRAHAGTVGAGRGTYGF